MRYLYYEKPFTLVDDHNSLLHYQESESASASGAIGLSTWYDFTGAEGEARFQGGDLLSRICELLESKDPNLPFDKLLCTLSTEAAHWEESIGSIPRRKLLKQLLKLLADAESQATRSKVAYTFAVLALAMHDFPSETITRKDTAARRRHRAKEAARHYTKRVKVDDSEVSALLLFGLASMMEHYEMHGLVEEDVETISIIAQQLKKLHILGGNRPIRILAILPSSFDIRAYVVDTLVQYINRPLNSGKLPLSDDIYTLLLEVISHRTYVWLNHSAQLLLPMAKILQAAGPPTLHRQCLIAMTEYWHTAPSQHDLQVLLDHDIHYRLVSLMKRTEDHMLRSHAISHFDSLTGFLQRPEWGARNGDEEVVPELLKRIIQEGLFEDFFAGFLHRSDEASKPNRVFWEEHTRDIAMLASPDSEVLEVLRAFYRANLGRTVWVGKLGPILFPDTKGKPL